MTSTRAGGGRAEMRVWPWALGLLAVAPVVVAVNVLVGSFVGGFVCGGDGGEPYAAPASGRGQVCDVLVDFNQAEWVGVVLILSPTIAFLLLGALSLVLRRRRLLLAAIATFVGSTLLLLVPLALPSTCPDDDENKPGCSHY